MSDRDEKKYSHAEMEAAMITADRACIAAVIRMLRMAAKTEPAYLKAQSPDYRRASRDTLLSTADALQNVPRTLQDIKYAIENYLKAPEVSHERIN